MARDFKPGSTGEIVQMAQKQNPTTIDTTLGSSFNIPNLE